MKRPILTIAFAAVTGLGLSACAKHVEPPGDRGVCFHVVPLKEGKLRYNKLAMTPNIETCAAKLEGMRIQFLRMGGSAQNIYGAYQTNFLFLEPQGVMTATNLESPRFTLLVRTGDGRLVMPTAIPTAP
jgi:hypothetical protein